MRASRLLSIQIMLQLRGRISAAALSREFEVSVRTIYRDMDELSAAGIPVYAEPGRSGGFALHEGFRTRLTGLTANEAAALAFIGAPMAADDLGLGDAAGAARLKLLASLSAPTAMDADRIAARFHLDPAPWYQHRAPSPHLRPLAEAVWSGRKVAITYESWKGQVRRTLSPLGLVLKAGEWYLAASMDRSVRTYRVAAISTLTTLAREAERPRGFDLARHWAQSAASFEKGLRSERITVRVSAEGMRRLREFSADLPARLSTTDATQGHWEGVLPWEPGLHGVRDVLRFGGELVVLAPADFRKAVALAAARLAAAHGATRKRRTKAPAPESG